MEPQTFQQVMAYLAAAYDAELTPERAAVYWDQLKALKGDVFAEAARSYVGHGRSFPNVSELREHYRQELRRRAAAAQPKLARRPPGDPRRVQRLVRKLREQLRCVRKTTSGKS